MKKRIFSICLCLILALGLLPLTAAAADITSVSISGLEHPVDGQNLDGSYTLPADADYRKDAAFDDVIWYDQGTDGFKSVKSYGGVTGTRQDATAKAVAGHYYVAELHLARTGSGMFPAKQFSAAVSDDMARRVMDSKGWSKSAANPSYEGAVYLFFIADKLYNSSNIVTLALDRAFDGVLKEGDAPWTAEALSNISYYYGSDGKSVANANDFDLSLTWRKRSGSNSYELAAGEKFQAGYTYDLILTLDAGSAGRRAVFGTDGWKLELRDSDSNAWEAGADISDHGYTARAAFSFPCRAAWPYLEIEGIEVPTAGQPMQTGGFTIKPYAAPVSAAAWYQISGTEFPIPAEGSFQPNTRYRLELTLGAVEGYTYDGLTKDKINVNLGDVTKLTAGSDEAVIGVEFSVGEVPDILITETEITVNAPKLENAPIFHADTEGSGYAVYDDDGASFLAGVFWHDETEDETLSDDDRVLKTHPDDAFRPGHTYRVSVELIAGDGYAFTESTAGVINGETTETRLQGDILTVTYTFAPLPVFSELKVTTPPDKTAYTAGETFDPAGMAVTACYGDALSLELAAADLVIEPDTALTEADTAVTLRYTDAEGVTQTATVEITVAAAADQPGDEIELVELTVEEPSAGGTASFAGAVPEDAAYTLESIRWFCDDDDQTLAEGDKFGKKTYIFSATLLPKEGCHFASELTLQGMINGAEAQARVIDGGKALLTQYFSLGDPNPFADVKEEDYFYDAVIWAYYAEPQVTNGMDNTHFGPDYTVTRGQAVTFLWRAMGCPEPTLTENPFEDVWAKDYYYKPILWALEKGITKGTDDTHFSPYQTCSTAHILTFLYRSMGAGADGWYLEARAWAVGAGLLQDLDVEVAPGVDCPRGDVVLFLYRAIVR